MVARFQPPAAVANLGWRRLELPKQLRLRMQRRTRDRRRWDPGVATSFLRLHGGWWRDSSGRQWCRDSGGRAREDAADNLRKRVENVV